MIELIKSIILKLLNLRVIVIPIFFIIMNSSCNRKYSESLFFNKSCQCDSVAVMSYDFIEEEDGSIYSIPKKEPFNFIFILDSSKVLIDNKEYHLLIAGIQKDTIGFIRVDNSLYKYREGLIGSEEILFNLNQQVIDTWRILEDGYFKNYKIKISNIGFDKVLNDSVYNFKCEFERGLPHGCSFTEFKISKHNGIVGYSIEIEGELGVDTINCICK